MRQILALAVLMGLGCAAAPDPAAPPLPELRTVETAITSPIVRGSRVPVGQSGYLGVHVVADGARFLVADVADGSPAAKAGIQAGDLLVAWEGEGVGDVDEFGEWVQARAPGEAVRITLRRQGEAVEVTATLGAVSRPMKIGEQRAILGVQLGDATEGEGAPITRVTRNSPAERAGLKTGERILRIDGAPVTSGAQLSDSMAERKPGDTVALEVGRGGKPEEIKVQLAADRAEAEGSGFFRGGSYWKKDVYRLAVIGIEYPDVKRNAKIAGKDWEESLFSRGTYAKKNSATGQPVYGSLNDYYVEQSCGALRVEGKAFDWVQVSRNRADYGQSTSSREKTVLLGEAIDKLLARDGKDALREFDGIFFVYAGDRVQTSRGGLYWPHRGSVTHQGKRWAYFIVQEGGSRMSSISVIAHEFGHMLGLPDLYARPENPGSEGLGSWCAMSNQNGNGRPQHLSAWCKEQLGWLKPAVIDPTVKQRLVLAAIEESPKECFKVLVRPDGSEYLLLENRKRKGFDQDLPAEGLLIWRVVRTRPMLEESHGVEGAAGPRVFSNAVPYPSAANDAFTPHTTPSSRSQLGGGLPVHITNIRRLPDGRISFHIGFQYQ